LNLSPGLGTGPRSFRKYKAKKQLRHEVKLERKRATYAASRPSSIQAQTLDAVTQMSKDVRDLVQVIKSQPSVNPQPLPAPTVANPGFNWNPVVQGLITGFASALGMSVSSTSLAPATTVDPALE
jgi:hypothetical protein